MESIADPGLLSFIWKKSLRSSFRSLRLAELLLAQDPLYYIAHDWDLSAIVNQLSTDIRSGTYMASPPRNVRQVKGHGLTRPIAHLSFRDAIVYKAIVSQAENSLVTSMPAWARMGRTDQRDDAEISVDSGWFRNWLRRQGQLWVISEEWKWIIETDIANFFPSVSADDVLSMTRTNSILGESCVHLLGQQLHVFSPKPNYRSMATWGLPQERSDASRTLAHSLLSIVDDEFKEEGTAGRYSRWMDDIVIGAESFEEAVYFIGRVQHAMGKIGLHPNSSKSRIYESKEFEREYMKNDNDYLGLVHDETEAGQPVDLIQFKANLKRHLALNEHRPKSWERVLRRYYTESRRLEDQTLIKYAFSHFRKFEASAANILDYLSVFRLTPQRLSRLMIEYNRLSPYYTSSKIIALEYLAQAPAANSQNLRAQIVDFAFDVIRSSVSSQDWEVGASAVAVLGKFGFHQDMAKLRVILERDLAEDTATRQQSILVLLGVGLLTGEDINEATPHSTFDSSVHLRFLRSLMAGDTKANELAMTILAPVQRTHPSRSIIRPRALFLAPIVREVDPPKYDRISQRTLIKLSKNPRRLRDYNAERWVNGLRQF
ncbi:MAG: hypothetical protein AB7G88_06060 [Thermomicrobiales bacterium]